MLSHRQAAHRIRHGVIMANAASEIINEEWRPVVGYEGWYEVSNLGRVRRVKPGRRTRPGRILRHHLNSYGYPAICLYRSGVQRVLRVHRLVAEAFIGQIPDTMEINHLNGIRYDNRIENLEITTRSGNLTHAYRVLGRRGCGASLKGEAHPQSKFTSVDVIAIRTRSANGEGQSDLAREFGVHRQTIHHIVQRRIWKHLP